MIAWSINAAKEANIFERIIVSTDDEEIAKVAEVYGAEVPFIRPSSISDDYATTGEVMAHACEWAEAKKIHSDFVCCLYATAPFVKAKDLVLAHQLILSNKWQYVFSASEYSSSIFRSFKQLSNGSVKMFYPEHFKTRSQDLPTAFFDAGMFYMAKKEAWLADLRIFDTYSFALKIPSWRVQDIDTDSDWKRAEMIAPYIHKKQNKT